MVKIPENFRGRVDQKVARQALTDSLTNKKNLKGPTLSTFGKMLKKTSLAAKSYGTISRQQYEKIRQKFLDNNYKIDKFDEQKIFQKESQRLDEIQKKKNIAYVHKEDRHGRGTLMIQRIRQIEEESMSSKGVEESPAKKKTYYDQRVDRLKNPKGLRDENPAEENDKGSQSPQKPQLVEPPDMFG